MATKKAKSKAAPIRKGAKSKLVEPKIVKGSDIDPNHQWKRPLQAPGHTQVDFEERVDFRRLHNYRLARVRQALANSGLGALLSFDQHNIRYTTSTVIGASVPFGNERPRTSNPSTASTFFLKKPVVL